MKKYELKSVESENICPFPRFFPLLRNSRKFPYLQYIFYFFQRKLVETYTKKKHV